MDELLVSVHGAGSTLIAVDAAHRIGDHGGDAFGQGGCSEQLAGMVGVAVAAGGVLPLRPAVTNFPTVKNVLTKPDITLRRP
jgi:hypothetical protein